MINGIIQGMTETAAYLDDLVVWSDTWEEHTECLQDLLDRLQAAGLTINLAKSKFARSTVTYLGHQVGQGAVRLKSANIESILSYPVPCTRKSLMRFFGYVWILQAFLPQLFICCCSPH